MSEVKEKIIKQATKLASTIADSLSSGGDLSLDMSQEIDSKVEEAVENMDIDSKVEGVICNSDAVLNDDNVRDIAGEAVSDYDWTQVISDNDLVFNSELDDKVKDVIDEVVDEKIEGVLDAKLFGLLQEFILNQFKPDAEAWMDAIRRQGVNKYLEEQKEKEEQPSDSTPAQV